MAGSNKWFKYTTDDGKTWGILRDESNMESVNDTAIAPISPAEIYKLPGNVEPRKAVFQSADGLIRREVVVLTQDRLGAITPAFSYADGTSGEQMFLKTRVGERITLPNLADTGQLDGDAD